MEEEGDYHVFGKLVVAHRGLEGGLVFLVLELDHVVEEEDVDEDTHLGGGDQWVVVAARFEVQLGEELVDETGLSLLSELFVIGNEVLILFRVGDTKRRPIQCSSE